MPQLASFSVGFEHAQPDENTGYNTQPACSKKLFNEELHVNFKATFSSGEYIFL